MTDVRPDDQIEDKSLGELVALASSNVSRLIRSEMELAKLELKDDAKKAALGSMLFTIAGVIGGIVVILLSIAAAYGLVAAGIWHWAAFLIVAGFYVVLAAVLIGIGYLRMRKITGIQRTRRTLKELTVLRRSSDTPAIPE
ncbi:phage holin family protein [Actinomadura sp. HBU206391]|uniref:phage holin family protein n=1 Tax=Actinomadura sp. HBU206391 TaxID=2731692 RepID=UPI0016508FBA|nr:phage holin family protein [Actinomadura sp. HBU206391]MBC6456322.1 phage holin family protein [Actinomadura sp. HBU206391]